MMGYTLVVHTRGNPAALAEPLRRQVFALDPGMAIYNEETMDEHIRTAYFAAAGGGDAVRGVWRDRPGAGGGGALRRDELCGQPADARDRHPHGDGRTGRDAVERLVVRQGMMLAASR